MTVGLPKTITVFYFGRPIGLTLPSEEANQLQFARFSSQRLEQNSLQFVRRSQLKASMISSVSYGKVNP
jgi:hypothetical protein